MGWEGRTGKVRPKWVHPDVPMRVLDELLIEETIESGELIKRLVRTKDMAAVWTYLYQSKRIKSLRFIFMIIVRTYDDSKYLMESTRVEQQKDIKRAVGASSKLIKVIKELKAPEVDGAKKEIIDWLSKLEKSLKRCKPTLTSKPIRPKYEGSEVFKIRPKLGYRTVYFIRELSSAIKGLCGSPEHKIVANITSAVFQKDITVNAVEKVALKFKGRELQLK